MSGTPTIWFLRHGQTDWNAQGRLQGHRDIDLNAHGLAQAGEAADRLRRVAGAELPTADYVASPLLRTRRTMEAVRARIGLPPTGYRADPRLREIGFGHWEGHTWSEIRRRDPAGARNRDRDRWGYRPQGDNGESYAMVETRVEEVVSELRRPTVMVSHGGVARALLVILGHLDIHAAVRMGIRQGSVLVLDAHGWRWA